MSMQDLYEEWRQKIDREGSMRGCVAGRKQDLRSLYEARFGAMPRELMDAIEATHDAETLHRWLLLAGTRSQEEFAAAVQAESTASLATS